MDLLNRPKIVEYDIIVSVVSTFKISSARVLFISVFFSSIPPLQAYQKLLIVIFTHSLVKVMHIFRVNYNF